MKTLSDALRRKVQGIPEWQYFDCRIRNSEEARKTLPYKTIRGETAITDALRNSQAPAPRVIYLHIPFCRKYCEFCGYTRELITDNSEPEQYVGAMIAQMTRYRNTPWAYSHPVEAIYVGGGTPTALPSELLVRLIKTARDMFPISENCEITVESRFDGMKPDDLLTLSEAGVNRISFGVQSFDTHVRQHIGRIHDSEKIFQTLEQVKKLKFKTICADLIYNLPRQSSEIWENDVRQLAHARISACSIYPLILFEKSLLSTRIRQGKEPPLNGIEAEYERYVKADSYLREVLNWQRFTPVQYGDVIAETASYVSAGSRGYDILGIGAGAAGIIGELRYYSSPNIREYISTQQNDSDAHLTAWQLPKKYLRARTWYKLSDGGCLNTDDVSYETLPRMDEVIEKLIELGAVRRQEKYLALTQTGCFWAGNISSIISGLIRDMAI
jgi:oxygen-independent coproporphyrinogen-3 oxidase